MRMECCEIDHIVPKYAVGEQYVNFSRQFVIERHAQAQFMKYTCTTFLNVFLFHTLVIN